ncbi:MAG TPA: hypothetical protein V6C97_35835 [Oculatellaceae cyanobacterium]
MFEWLLIGFELAILYFAFWYVFIKEPDVYKIKGDPWGTYEGNPYAYSNHDNSIVQMPTTKQLYNPHPGKNAA